MTLFVLGGIVIAMICIGIWTHGYLSGKGRGLEIARLDLSELDDAIAGRSPEHRE